MLRRTEDKLRTRLSLANIHRRFLVSEAASLQRVARGLSWAQSGPFTSSRGLVTSTPKYLLIYPLYHSRLTDVGLHRAQFFSLLRRRQIHHFLKMENIAKGCSASDEKEKMLAGSSSGTSAEYRLPLVWINLKTTGLNVEVDRILEIACVITDGKLTNSVEGPDLLIHQTKECLDEIGDWCQSHHAARGLKERVLQSTISQRDAEMQVIEFVKSNIGSYTPNLAGNSVYVDFQFLKKYMPDLAGLFSHVLIDVSSIRALCCRWFPKDYDRRPCSKEKRQGAMDDIRESIKELNYYKDTIFKPKSRK